MAETLTPAPEKDLRKDRSHLVRRPRDRRPTTRYDGQASVGELRTAGLQTEHPRNPAERLLADGKHFDSAGHPKRLIEASGLPATMVPGILTIVADAAGGKLSAVRAMDAKLNAEHPALQGLDREERPSERGAHIGGGDASHVTEATQRLNTEDYVRVDAARRRARVLAHEDAMSRNGTGPTAEVRAQQIHTAGEIAAALVDQARTTVRSLRRGGEGHAGALIVPEYQPEPVKETVVVSFAGPTIYDNYPKTDKGHFPKN